MNEALPILAALYAGLAGSMHCVSMCGGIAALGGMGSQRPLSHVSLFNAGRILSYMLAGGVGAWLVSVGFEFAPSRTARIGVAFLTGGVLAAIGLYFAFGLRLFSALESLGARFWTRLSPLVSKLLPIRHPVQALALGGLWGWLPCGLFYVTLPLAWSTGSAETGALVMAMFGLGTAPAMIGVGLGGGGVRAALRRPAVRRAAGVTMIAFGALMAASPWLFGHGGSAGHHDHAEMASTLTIGGLNDADGTAFRYVCGDPDRLRDQFYDLHRSLVRVDLPEEVGGTGDE
ncbi:MAG: sulfite exporter TauE/SafE family protein [Pseudomonadota bacterium]